MKKRLSIVLTLLLISALAVGCSGTTPTNGSPDSAKPEKSNSVSIGGHYTMATAGTAGTFYPYGGALCQVINRAIGTSITATATGGGRENIALLENEEVEFALVDTDMMSYALTGSETFSGKRVDTFAAIASLFPQVVQVVVSADSDIYTIKDLKGKRVSVGDAGSGTAINASQILDAYGMTVKDLRVNYLSFKESASAFQDKSLDAFFAVAGIPTTAIVEVGIVDKIRILPIDQEYADILISKYPFFSATTINKDTYGTEGDIQTLSVKAAVAALKKVDENIAYHFTRALFENLQELADAHAKGKELTLESALEGIDVSTLHPGAAKYYKEVGLIK
jgi:TRAP transporter TAXI family solute receptor